MAGRRADTRAAYHADGNLQAARRGISAGIHPGGGSIDRACPTMPAPRSAGAFQRHAPAPRRHDFRADHDGIGRSSRCMSRCFRRYRPGGALAVTTNLNINFLRKPGPGRSDRRCPLMKLGKRLAVGEVDIYSDGRPNRWPMSRRPIRSQSRRIRERYNKYHYYNVLICIMLYIRLSGVDRRDGRARTRHLRTRQSACLPRFCTGLV